MPEKQCRKCGVLESIHHPIESPDSRIDEIMKITNERWWMVRRRKGEISSVGRVKNDN